MATRSFTVFQDTPSSSSDTKAQAPKPVRVPSGILTRSAASKANLPPSDPAVAIDKENYNPITGQRTSSNTTNGEKKRKTTVLSTKSHIPVISKKEKSAEPELKKRKTGTTKSKSSSSKKEPKTATSGRKIKRTSPSRRTSPLPKVVEEDATTSNQAASEEIAQAAINARCYELTVSPLADVSEAYEASTSSTSRVGESEKGPFQTVKEPSVEPELRDYFSPEPPTLGSLASSRLGHLVEEPEDKPAAHAFSTPERRKIYASFTFASPSPSSKRFRDVYGSQPASPTRLTTTKKANLFSDPVDHDEAFTLLHHHFRS